MSKTADKKDKKEEGKRRKKNVGSDLDMSVWCFYICFFAGNLLNRAYVVKRDKRRYYIYWMTHNSNWFFESPYPKAPNLYNPQPLKAEAEHEGEDSHWIKPIFISPEPIPPIFGAKACNQLSPWSKLINYDHDSKLDHIDIHDLIPEQG